MITTGFISRTNKRGIALFYNSKAHAGENMEHLLTKRDMHADTVIQMCDALSRIPGDSFTPVECDLFV